MNWTREAPTVAGWWWHQSYPGSSIPEIYEVLTAVDDDGEEFEFVNDGAGGRDVDDIAGEWAGPIPEPVESQEDQS